MADRVERYLAELRAALEVSAPLAERIVAEAEDHLREGAAWEADRGLSPEEAQREVVARFGPPEVVARWWNEIYQREYGGGKMWQRFTERARRVVFFAQEEAARLGENHVATEHMLLGLVRETDHVAAGILQADLGISLTSVHEETEKRVTRGHGNLGQDMELTPPAKRMIDLAYEEARSFSNNYIGTEHLLLGLIREEEGLGGRVLRELGATLEKARRAVQAGQEVEKTLIQRVKEQFLQAVERGAAPSPEMRALIRVLTLHNPAQLADAITSYLALTPEDEQALQPAKTNRDRLEKVSELLARRTIKLEPSSEERPGEGETPQEIAPQPHPASQTGEREGAPDAQIARVADTILQQAVTERAAAIQIDPVVNFVVVRFWIEDTLQGRMKLPRDIHPRLLAHFKEAAGLDPEEHSLAQIGLMSLVYQGEDYALEVRIEPALEGEKLLISVPVRE